MSERFPVVFIPHGGGPLPLLGDPAHAELVAFLDDLGRTLPRPEAIVVVSAHWEAPVPTLTGSAAPGVLHDYAGFPPEAYRIRYDAPGAPALAGDIAGMLGEVDGPPRLDAERPLDHGVFVPLVRLFPAADIPVVQLSLLSGLDPERHLALGERLATLRERNVLLLGSGLSFHAMPAFFSPTPNTRADADAFDRWLVETTTGSGRTPRERRRRLVDWASAPSARACHPREEHLLPLHVCSGAAGHSPAELAFNAPVLGHRTSGLVWRD